MRLLPAGPWLSHLELGAESCPYLPPGAGMRLRPGTCQEWYTLGNRNCHCHRSGGAFGEGEECGSGPDRLLWSEMSAKGVPRGLNLSLIPPRAQNWKKFGNSEFDPPGPNVATTTVSDDVSMTFITSKEVSGATRQGQWLCWWWPGCGSPALSVP